MAYPIDKKLVVGITSSALFDFTAEDEIFRTEGLAAFKKYQIDNRKKPPLRERPSHSLNDCLDSIRSSLGNLRWRL
ncbi:5'-nucleotidase [Sphingomonas hankookensis]|uniref:5'-nucleotidase n=1 Tax=Sphingomonas hankookensis TaxID=563996 RepID=UPI003D3036A5